MQAGRRGSALDLLLRARGVLYNALFVLYMGVVQPRLLARLLRMQEAGSRDWLLAALVVVAMGAEMLGFRLKWPALKARIRRWPANSDTGVAVMLLASIMHLALNSFLFLSILPALGLGFSVKGFLPGVAQLALLFLVLIKEAFFIGIFVTRVGGFPSPDNEANRFVLRLADAVSGPDAEPADPDARAAQVCEMLGDLLLLAYGAIALTLTWDAIVAVAAPLRGPDKGWALLGLVLMFCFTYAPSRLVFIVEFWYVRHAPLQRAVNAATFVVVFVLAMRSMV